MKKLVQINPVIRINTSTGRIMQEIGGVIAQNGWENYIVYSKGRDGVKDSKFQILPVGNKWSVAWHGIMTRLFDRHGLASNRATKKLIEQLEQIQPSLIHIHNIHGYFLNYKILFEYLSQCNIPIVWTIHDCWSYTGHCYHYSFEKCYKWKDVCHHCPQKTKFPSSFIIDRSRQNFEDKKKAFTSIPTSRMMIVPVSDWMRKEMEHSFFRKYNFRVIHNGIDTDVFCVCPTKNIRAKFGIKHQHVILGLASIWSEEKGLADFLRLARLVNENELIVLVGVNDKQKAMLPSNVLGISRTENIHQLAELYSVATVFVNLTWQDNYPTVNLEAIACGTPVVTYRTGGSVESVTEDTGLIVEQGDIDGVIKAIWDIEERGKAYYTSKCREYAVKHFRKEDRYADYVSLYEEVIQKN